ncbi:hypothetical protein BHM03_00039763 [Ensete ventricosum]|nr:hypothetical protein BHM03_00039763 [Ensete ventricosum]
MLCLLPEHKQPRLARHRRDVFDPLSDRPRSPITPPLISPRSPFPLPIFIRIFTAGTPPHRWSALHPPGPFRSPLGSSPLASDVRRLCSTSPLEPPSSTRSFSFTHHFQDKDAKLLIRIVFGDQKST